MEAEDRPVAGPPIPERGSRAGDSSEPAGDHHSRRPDGDLGAAALGRLPDGLDARGSAAFGQHPMARQWVRKRGAVLLGVCEPGPVGALLAPDWSPKPR